jgi:hypothetical protein
MPLSVFLLVPTIGLPSDVICQSATARRPEPTGDLDQGGQCRPSLVIQAARAAALLRIDTTVVCVHKALPCFVRMPAAVSSAAISR